jgi:MFS family permease
MEASSASGLAGESQLEKQAIQKESETVSRVGSDVTPPAAEAKGTVERSIRGWKWAVAMATILSTTFLFALDNTIVADIQPSIINQFNDVERLPWFGVGFGLGSTAILPWGKAYGTYSVKWLFITTVILFEVGSAICGAAPNVNALIIGRILAGVGGSGMVGISSEALP